MVFWGLAAFGMFHLAAAKFRQLTGGEPLHPSEFPGSSVPLAPVALPLDELDAEPANAVAATGDGEAEADASGANAQR
jgi:hypothetical protein